MNKNKAHSQNYYEGKDYQKNKDLSTTEIAKIVRDELKKKYPTKDGYKFSVRSKYFSGGSSIDVDIKAVPFKVMNPERLRAEKEFPHDFNEQRRFSIYTTEAEIFLHDPGDLSG